MLKVHLALTRVHLPGPTASKFTFVSLTEIVVILSRCCRSCDNAVRLAKACDFCVTVHPAYAPVSTHTHAHPCTAMHSHAHTCTHTLWFLAPAEIWHLSSWAYSPRHPCRSPYLSLPCLLPFLSLPHSLCAHQHWSA